MRPEPRLIHTGFTLIEVLVTLLVLALGLLGIALYTGEGLRASADNNVRATALQVASQVVEPLHLAARGGAATFKAALDAAFPAAAAPPYSRIVAMNTNESFTVSVPESGGAPLAFDDAATPVNWLTSVGTEGVTVTVTVQVGYTRIDGAPQNVVTSFTFIITKA